MSTSFNELLHFNIGKVLANKFSIHFCKVKICGSKLKIYATCPD